MRTGNSSGLATRVKRSGQSGRLREPVQPGEGCFQAATAAMATSLLSAGQGNVVYVLAISPRGPWLTAWSRSRRSRHRRRL
jgi:hypothetical protein